MGGMTTVIWTDVMQFFLFIGSGFLALIWMVSMLPEGWSQFITQAGAAGKFEIFRWVPPAGSEASFLSWMKDAEFTMWTALFAMPFQNPGRFRHRSAERAADVLLQVVARCDEGGDLQRRRSDRDHPDADGRRGAVCLLPAVPAERG
jgi:Na+/proline symporter